MKSSKPAIAAAELVLLCPAALFMASLFLREVQPQQFEPAHSANFIVNWYAMGPVWFTLWILLMAMPLAVLILGLLTLVRSWKRDTELRHASRQTLSAIRSHWATLFIAAATLTAGVVLMIVALHMIAD